jgi:hypothetical protein
MIKFPMLPLVFVPGIPSQHQVSQLKIILFGSLVKDLLNVLLDDLSLVENILSSLMQMNHLIDSPLRVIRFSLHLLK